MSEESTYLQQALPRVVIHRTQAVKKRWNRSTIQPYEEEPRASNENFQSTKSDKDGFSPAVVRSRLEQKESRY